MGLCKYVCERKQRDKGNKMIEDWVLKDYFLKR